ncbi:M48 family metallopeptidase [Caenimonas aquaedulcis]|uniref:M48 family metallopeptidase n=1 Tax=Caenimonas aquaedulcis TaxID=2793270 RepID=UPI00338F2712
MPQPIPGRWFDGRSTRPRPCHVTLRPGGKLPALVLRDDADGAILEIAGSDVGWPERWSTTRAPRTVVADLRDHGSLEVDDVAAWQAALAAAGGKPPLAQRMQTRWPVFAVVMAVAAVALVAFYRWGTPWAATQVTRQVPLAWETELSQRALRDLDANFLKPSKLPAARQAQLRERFDALSRQVGPAMQPYRDYAPGLSLSFRGGMPPNAFALPGGTIVMTDSLVEIAQRRGLDDDALAGVLAHEIGHVVHRHTTRIIVEQAVLNVGLGLALGDVSTLVSMGGSLLTGLAYRRGHETEADCFAADLMRRARVPTAPMADLLLGMEQDRGATAGGERGGGFSDLLSSHPATAQRARDLKAGHAEACRK